MYIILKEAFNNPELTMVERDINGYAIVFNTYDEAFAYAYDNKILNAIIVDTTQFGSRFGNKERNRV